MYLFVQLVKVDKQNPHTKKLEKLITSAVASNPGSLKAPCFVWNRLKQERNMFAAPPSTANKQKKWNTRTEIQSSLYKPYISEQWPGQRRLETSIVTYILKLFLPNTLMSNPQNASNYFFLLKSKRNSISQNKKDVFKLKARLTWPIRKVQWWSFIENNNEKKKICFYLQYN